ncbi:hypothetical protein V5799_012690 [Amblyomma americanum]|uniref:Uncharacterized protein n=1 Tax=Amblyomma americanum TaxID=6943 RepID=A0AAQ4E839_AMBAM
MFSACKIVGNAQTCACKEPLTWDDSKKACVLEKQFRYAFAFKEPQYRQDRCHEWHREDLAVDIHEAMKNLYGKELSASRLVECGKERKAELTFKTEPLPPTLNRIHQCENKAEDSCLFAPYLRIIEGSVSGPTAVDLCTEFFKKIPAVLENGLECHKDEGGDATMWRRFKLWQHCRFSERSFLTRRLGCGADRITRSVSRKRSINQQKMPVLIDTEWRC